MDSKPTTTPPAATSSPSNRWTWLKSRRNRLVIGLVLLTIIIGVVGLLIYQYNKNSKRPSSTLLATSDYTNPAGLYKLSLPSGWQVQTNIAAPAGVREQVALAPTTEIEKYKQVHKNDFLEFVIIQTIDSKLDPQAWFNGLGLATPVSSANISLDSRPTYAAKTIGPAGMDDHYVISNNGVIVYMVFHQRVTVNETDTDNTKYLQGFDRIATSIKFIK